MTNNMCVVNSVYDDQSASIAVCGFDSAGQIAEKIMVRIKSIIEKDDGRNAFSVFIDSVRVNVNADVSESEAIEMLVQHILTKPIFDALFGGFSFSKNNEMSKAMGQILDVLDAYGINRETDSLTRFYARIADKVKQAGSDSERQDIIRSLYDTLFKVAFPMMTQRLGIVYTPVEIVDFILRSTDEVVRKYFGCGLGDKRVNLLDPFTGTGTFITRLIQSDIISDEDLIHKYASEIQANEIVLLAYYIAAINIESAYHSRTGDYLPFSGAVLCDTFQSYDNQHQQGIEKKENDNINVVIGNPPYSGHQRRANDNNQNAKYIILDQRIRDTYIKESLSSSPASLYDSYIKAIRVASDRVSEKGVVGFITNGSFIDGAAASGLRKCLYNEFSHIYVLNLRGFVRGKQGEAVRVEGSNVFDIMTGVAIVILVKDPEHSGPCELLYHDIGDYLTKKDKLTKIKKFSSISSVPWISITPNESGDWINQRTAAFRSLIPLKRTKNGENAIFSVSGNGVCTGRDAWAYNKSRAALENNIKKMIDTFNRESAAYAECCACIDKKNLPKPESIIDLDLKKIRWTRTLIDRMKKNEQHDFDHDSIIVSMYRPFTKQYLYSSSGMHDRASFIQKFFPTPAHKNVCITTSGTSAYTPFSVLVTDFVSNHGINNSTQCFCLYWYESVSCKNSAQMSLFEGMGGDAAGYVRHDSITDWALNMFQEKYMDTTIRKEDIFWYVYGMLHSAVFCEKFKADLNKEMPRIPLAPDFWGFSNAGAELGLLHLNYENVAPWELEEVWSSGTQAELWEDGEKDIYLVDKINYAVKKTKGADGYMKQRRDSIAYNNSLTLKGIPNEAYDYVVNGKPVIQWIMEQYSVRVDKDSGLVNDPNMWRYENNDPAYIVNLIKKVVRVSMETVRIMNDLKNKEIG